MDIGATISRFLYVDELIAGLRSFSPCFRCSLLPLFSAMETTEFRPRIA